MTSSYKFEFLTERVSQRATRNIYAAVTCRNVVNDCVFEVTMGSYRETDVGVVVGPIAAMAGIILYLFVVVLFIVVVIVVRRRQMRKPVQEEFSGLIANNVNNTFPYQQQQQHVTPVVEYSRQ